MPFSSLSWAFSFLNRWISRCSFMSFNYSKDFSTRKQCELLGINRSSLYYQPKPISELDLTLMNLLDEQYTKTPFYGVKRI